MDPLLDALRPIIEPLIERIVQEKLRALGAAAPGAPYLSTKEAALLARVTQRTIRRWIDNNRLKAYGAGRELRVERAQLEGLMRQGRRKRSRAPESPEARAARHHDED